MKKVLGLFEEKCEKCLGLLEKWKNLSSIMKNDQTPINSFNYHQKCVKYGKLKNYSDFSKKFPFSPNLFPLLSENFKKFIYEIM